MGRGPEAERQEDRDSEQASNKQQSSNQHTNPNRKGPHTRQNARGEV